jgi:hypothetical protein
MGYRLPQIYNSAGKIITQYLTLSLAVSPESPLLLKGYWETQVAALLTVYIKGTRP